MPTWQGDREHFWQWPHASQPKDERNKGLQIVLTKWMIRLNLRIRLKPENINTSKVKVHFKIQRRNYLLFVQWIVILTLCDHVWVKNVQKGSHQCWINEETTVLFFLFFSMEKKEWCDISVLFYLGSPNVVQILQSKGLLLNDESQDFLQFFHILWLMKAVPQYNGQNVILLNPLLGDKDSSSAYSPDLLLSTSDKVNIKQVKLTAMRSAVSHSASSGLPWRCV